MIKTNDCCSVKCMFLYFCLSSFMVFGLATLHPTDDDVLNYDAAVVSATVASRTRMLNISLWDSVLF